VEITAVLNLNQSPGTIRKPRPRLSRKEREEILDHLPFFWIRIYSPYSRGIVEFLRRPLGITASNHDPRTGIGTGDTADKLSNVAVSPAGDRAGVHHYQAAVGWISLVFPSVVLEFI
jgi:hypothetical protein